MNGLPTFKINTGIKKLDELLKGGLRENSNVLIISPPGNEKLALASQFINEGLKNKQQCLYVTTDISPNDIENRSNEFGWRFFSYTNKGLRFVDCYSWTLGTPPANRNDIQVPGPSALNDLSIGITQAMQEIYKPMQKTRVVFNSISTLLLYNNPEIVYRFTQVTGARLKSTEATSLFLLESGMHDEKVLTTLKHLVDSVIEIKQDNNKLLLSMPMDGISNWLEFKLTGSGIELV